MKFSRQEFSVNISASCGLFRGRWPDNIGCYLVHYLLVKFNLRRAISGLNYSVVKGLLPIDEEALCYTLAIYLDSVRSII